MFGAFGRSLTESSVTFVSQASLEKTKTLGLAKGLVLVMNTRKIGKHSMILNSATPRMEVNPETYEVRADGRLLTCEPAKCCPWLNAISCTDMTMHCASIHRSAGYWPIEEAAGGFTLDFDARHRRRIRLTTDQGEEVLLDLPKAVAMADGDGLQAACHRGAGGVGVGRKCASRERDDRRSRLRRVHGRSGLHGA